MKIITKYDLQEVVPYINWIYFFHAWQYPPRFATVAGIYDCAGCLNNWLATFSEEEVGKARSAAELYADAQAMLKEWSGEYKTFAAFLWEKAWSQGDNVVIELKKEGAETFTLPFLRRQQPDQQNECPCLADFIAPKDYDRQGKVNLRGTSIGAFATTVDERLEKLYADDPYKHLLAQTLADRLAEATAERMHEQVRTQWVGYAPQENFTKSELFAEKYEGRRPAVGYPSLPDQSFNFLLHQLLGLEEIGIRLTQSGMMQPHASVSGLLFDHPLARHFSVGRITEEQLEDYAQRRGSTADKLRPFLAANLD